MTRNRSPRVLLVLPSVAVLAALGVAACGGADASYFDTSPSGATTATPGPDNRDGTLQGGPASTTDACVSSATNAALTPANLVFMYDRSGSMGATTEGFDPSVKWIPVGSGMKAFFTDPGSAGINASLQFFPLGADVAAMCAADYGTPEVTMTALSNAAALVAAIDAPSPRGGTPTLPALEGAIHYAGTIAAARPADKTVIVLVTDGEPGYRINGQNVTGCTDNDVAHVAAAARAAFTATPSIPTYVIGVGASLQNLNAIAAAGGTGQATMVSVTDPAVTRASFQKSLDAIRAQTLSCDLALPAPPDGKTLNVNAVNVAFTSGAGVETILAYDAGCASGAGWHYDDVAAPTKIELCPAACSTAQADRAGKLQIALGCVTKGDVK
jgi:hypothetical protein